MTPDRILRLLEAVAAGKATPVHAVEMLAHLPSDPVAVDDEPPFARLDHHRMLRIGMPEVVYAAGKTEHQVVEICSRLAGGGSGFLATRADAKTRAALLTAFPSAEAHDLARIVHLSGDSPPDSGVPVAVVSAGTADLPVAEEAAVTAAALGLRVDRLYDVGVAGMHRILEHSARVREAAVVIVVAGMEGALPSVVGGIVGAPVIAVPTSIGYGAAFAGVTALLGMLNSCSAGVVVMNIDNGFGAACAASRIARAIRTHAT